MKHLLFTTIAAVLLVGCATTQSPEPSTAKAPDISIHEAAFRGNIEAVKQHLAAGTDVNAERREMTPLHWAASEGHNEVVKLLITKGADVNSKNDARWTPLHYAAEEGHKEVAKLLVANAAGVNAKGYMGTPLHVAASEGHKEVIVLENLAIQ